MTQRTAADQNTALASVFESGIEQRLLREARLRTRLGSALYTDDLFFNWQPLYTSNSGALAGFELLARWHDAEFGVVGPDEFVPLADADDKHRRQLVERALGAACARLAGWQQRLGGHAPFVAINIPGAEFYRADFPLLINDALIRHGADGQGLVLELTERSLIAEYTTTAETMRALKKFGVTIALDDFGSGYSSIGYLANLPLATVKIDKSLVQRIHEDADAHVLMQSIVNLTHGQGLKVVAEGIETPAQRSAAHAMGCEYLQGYLLARPGSGDTAEDLVNADGQRQC